jgi:hypothetical protein
MGVGGQRHAAAALLLGKGIHYPEYAGWAPGPVWRDAENLAPIGIRSADRPATTLSSDTFNICKYSSFTRNSALE